MSDEQTRLLQQILDTQKEHLAFAKQHSERALALSDTALATQKSAMTRQRRVLRVLLLIMIVLLGIMAYAIMPPRGEPTRHSSESTSAQPATQ